MNTLKNEQKKIYKIFFWIAHLRTKITTEGFTVGRMLRASLLPLPRRGREREIDSLSGADIQSTRWEQERPWDQNWVACSQVARNVKGNIATLLVTPSQRDGVTNKTGKSYEVEVTTFVTRCPGMDNEIRRIKTIITTIKRKKKQKPYQPVYTAQIIWKII